MSDEIGFGGNESPEPISAPARQLIPMRIGSTAVYVEQVGEPAEVGVSDEIYPAAPPSPAEAFEKAGEALQECVRVVGEKVESLAEKAKPEQVTVEFTLSFEATGKAQLIPVLLTGETKATTGLKVTAVWGLGAGNS